MDKNEKELRDSLIEKYYKACLMNGIHLFYARALDIFFRNR